MGAHSFLGQAFAVLSSLGLNDVFEHHDVILEVHYDVASCWVSRSFYLFVYVMEINHLDSSMYGLDCVEFNF